MAGNAAGSKAVGCVVEDGRSVVCVGDRGDFLWHFSRAYDSYLGVVERLGCSEKLVSFCEFSGAFARGDVDVDHGCRGYCARLGGGVGSVVDATVGTDVVVAGSSGHSDGVFAVDGASVGLGTGVSVGKMGLVNAGMFAGKVPGAERVFCGDDVVTREGFSAGCVEGPFGVQGANELRAKDFERVESCAPEGVQVVGAGGADCVVGSAFVREDVVQSVAEVCGVGATGSSKVGVKKKMGKNQRDRAKWAVDSNWRKPVDEGVPVVGKSELRVSLERKWAAQNELAAEKARKDLEYQRARDVDAEARTTRAKLLKVTEQSKVAVEKAFSTLKSTGNVPGFCETVVSDGGSVPGLSGGSSAEGCTISPDSSASMHEFREAQKKVLDLEDKIRKMERAERMRATVGEIAITNDGDEPSPSLQEEMDRQDEKYNTQYVYEPAAIGGKNVLLLRCETFGDYCEGEDY